VYKKDRVRISRLAGVDERRLPCVYPSIHLLSERVFGRSLARGKTISTSAGSADQLLIYYLFSIARI
jgi:hypothetical protein